MIQDIAPHIFSNAYAPKRPEATSYALYFNGHTVLAGKDSSTLRFPRFSELNGIEESVYEKAIYLFAIDNDCFYLVHQVPEEQPEFELKDIGLFRTSGPRHLAFAGITGYSLYKWYDNHQFCSHCGAKLVHHEKERMLHCQTCNNTEYPKNHARRDYRCHEREQNPVIQIRKPGIHPLRPARRIYRDRGKCRRNRETGSHGGSRITR